ncbi:MAG: LptF/LptG family permease [Bacteroidia bacterium]
MKFYILDKYIIKKFLGTFFYAVLMFGVVLPVIFDLTEKMDDIIEKEIPISELLLDYYLNFVPYFANLFTPIFAFISVVFFTSKMANQTEIVAILSSGVSFRRLLRPFMLSAIVVAMFSFVLGSFIIPPANERRLAFEYKYMKFNWNRHFSNLHRQVVPGTFVYLESYTQNTGTGFRFTQEKFKGQTMEYKISADYIRWDSIAQTWSLDNMIYRKFNGSKETIRKVVKLDTIMEFKPKDFALADDDVEMMNFFELNEFIERERSKGSEFIDYYLLEKHRRMANPVSNIILALIAVPLAGRKVRGGVGLHIGIGIGISFSYVMLMQISSVFATEGGIDASLAAWIPNAIYLLLAFWLLDRAPK